MQASAHPRTRRSRHRHRQRSEARRHADAVKRADVIALLDDIANRPAPIMSNRVLALLRKVYNFGIQRGVLEVNPCALVRPVGVEKRRERILTEDEVRGLWRGLQGEVLKGGKLRDGTIAKEGQAEQGEALSLVAAVRLMLLTAQRRGEVLTMRWEDISKEPAARPATSVPQGEAEAAAPPLLWTWTIPAASAKNGRAHRVPLSPQAVGVLESLTPEDAWVLPEIGRAHV